MKGQIHRVLAGRTVAACGQTDDDLVVFTTDGTMARIAFDEQGPQLVHEIISRVSGDFWTLLGEINNRLAGKAISMVGTDSTELLYFVLTDGHEVVIGPGPRFIRQDCTVRLDYWPGWVLDDL